MGEIAEMMLEGFLDEETGEVIDGDAPGYPRRMSEMHDVSIPRVRCPVCKRVLRGDHALAQHRASKSH